MADDDKGGKLINVQIDLGKYEPTATRLVDRISEAIGAFYKPIGMRREARAQVDVQRIFAEGRLELSDIEARGLSRQVYEAGKEQAAIEGITQLALPDLTPEAKPGEVDLDWLTYFFGLARQVSDAEMQTAWARVLAGEANRPNSFSKRSLQVMATLSKSEAELFTRASNFVWQWPDSSVSIFVYEVNKGLSFGELTHLDSIGLVTFDTVATFTATLPDAEPVLSYHGKHVKLTLPHASKELVLGNAMLTQTGRELAWVANPTGNDAAFRQAFDFWIKEGYAPARQDLQTQ